MAHRPAFQQMATQVPAAAADKPFERLIRIVGHLASSAQYSSRKAVTDMYAIEQLRHAGAAQETLRDWIIETNRKRGPNLDTVLRDARDGSLLRALLFFEETERWAGPIVDRDPTVPLSERDGIAKYDGARNYLHWLDGHLAAESEERTFRGPGRRHRRAARGIAVRPAPLCAADGGRGGDARSRGIAGSALFDVIERDPLVANIGQAQHVLRQDYLGVNAAALGLSKWRPRWAAGSATPRSRPRGAASWRRPGGRHRRERSNRRAGRSTDGAARAAALRAHRPVLVPARCVDHRALRATARAAALCRSRSRGCISAPTAGSRI